MALTRGAGDDAPHTLEQRQSQREEEFKTQEKEERQGKTKAKTRKVKIDKTKEAKDRETRKVICGSGHREKDDRERL
jgi:hypothetical protein